MYVPSAKKVIYSYDVVFDGRFYGALVYISQPYSKEMAIYPAVTYIPCATSSREQTGNIIMFTQFEEGNKLTKTSNNAENDDDDSIMAQLPRDENKDAMDSEDESDHDLMYIYMLEDICGGSQSHPNVNQREAHYIIRDRIRQRQLEWKGALKYT